MSIVCNLCNLPSTATATRHRRARILPFCAEAPSRASEGPLKSLKSRETSTRRAKAVVRVRRLLVAFPFLNELQSTPRYAFAVTSEIGTLHYRYLRAA